MLSWAGSIGLGGGSLRYAIGLSPGLRLYAMTRHRMIYDSSWDVADPGPPSTNLTLYALLAGELWLRAPDEHVMAPALLVMSQQLVDGCQGRRTRHYVNAGDPLRVCQISFASSAWRGPTLGASDAVLSIPVAPEMIAQLDEASTRFQHQDAAASRTAAIEIAELFIRAGLLADSAHPLRSTGWGRGVDRVWGAMSRMLSVTMLPSLDELGGLVGLSSRQLQRDFLELATTMALSPSLRWRTTMLHWRIKLALSLLSAPDSTTSAVARAVGYSEVEALARAFVQADLERPAIVRDALRAIAAAPPGQPRSAGRRR